MASEQNALRAWVQSRKNTPWSPGFSDDFKQGYDAAIEECEAALAAATAVPEIDMERLALALVFERWHPGEELEAAKRIVAAYAVQEPDDE